MKKLEDAVEYCFCFLVGHACLTLIYGAATILAGLQILGLYKPPYAKSRSEYSITPLSEDVKVPN